MSFDFTLKVYHQLCQTIIDAGYTVIPLVDQLRHHSTEPWLILRHDVDRWPSHALQMAILEQSLGLRSTYYFRSTKAVFQPNIIRQIEAQGHEIGYHYETLANCHGDYEKARLLFERELTQFRKFSTIETIAMHGSPLSPHDNRALWQQYDYKQYDLLGEAYLDIDYTEIGYLTDTGRSWASVRTNLRDRPIETNALQLPLVHTTADLINLVQSQQYPRLIIQTHPERWAYSRLSCVRSFSMDMAVNLIKLLLPTRPSYRPK